MRELTCQQIAEVEDISRQAISQTIKRALRKLFKAYKEEYPELSDFDICVKLMIELDIEINKKNFNCFPLAIKKSVKESAITFAEENNFFIPLDK